MVERYTLIFLLTLFLVFNSTKTYAYLDPGSISLILQAIIASIAGAAITWRHWYWKILSFFRIQKKKPDRDNNRSSETSSEDE